MVGRMLSRAWPLKLGVLESMAEVWSALGAHEECLAAVIEGIFE
jgi:hypothetical protein